MKVEALNMAVMSRNLSAGDGIKTKSDAEFQVEKISKFKIDMESSKLLLIDD